jgi:phosphoglycolate phosphatase
VNGVGVPGAPPLLLLFDVDGTLVWRASLEHSEALHIAIHEVHGVDTHASRAHISPAGRTDGEIARMILLDVGVSQRAIDEHAADVAQACVQAYARLCPLDLSDKLVPGIVGLLSSLKGRDEFRLSLVTGNFEGVARLKLKRAGIGHYFPTGEGAFGSDSEDRAALPHIARKRAGHEGREHPRARTIVIGDTPRDIACARADDLRVFAVATGASKASDLTEADAVALDPRELQRLLEAAL